jgi:hypothetical protein
VVIDGVEQKAHYLAVDLPHPDDCFVVAFPAQTTEGFRKAMYQLSQTSEPSPRGFFMATPRSK